eukprot:SAG31_NODE_5034_length_2787_cov_5.411086_4_plen_31_part_00
MCAPIEEAEGHNSKDVSNEDLAGQLRHTAD